MGVSPVKSTTEEANWQPVGNPSCSLHGTGTAMAVLFMKRLTRARYLTKGSFPFVLLDSTRIKMQFKVYPVISKQEKKHF